jgi:hypothetical protein
LERQQLGHDIDDGGCGTATMAGATTTAAVARFVLLSLFFSFYFFPVLFRSKKGSPTVNAILYSM